MKLALPKKHNIILITLLLSLSSFCQQTIVETGSIANFNNAITLFNNKAYAAAQKILIDVQKKPQKSTHLQADAAYYDAMCAVRLKQPDADKKVLTFINENPNSSKKNSATYNVANYYFANKKAAYALKWYSKVNINALSRANREELNFKMGYCYLVTKNLNLAKDKFIQLINSPIYGNDSRYYYGYIAYKMEDYGLAESTLKEIENNDTYKLEISYYLLDIYFKAGKFERSIKIGKELLKKVKKKQKSEVSKIIGESYFNLQKYAEAIPYLKEYEGKKGKWNNTDFYQLGYAHYKQNDFKNAINNFNKIIDQKNAVSQNAYYHLGECYMKLAQKSEALNAFKSASEMYFNEKIKEDAALNYAKLSYEIGNPFKSVSEVLQDYLKNYPKSKAYDEIEGFVIASYLHQGDYQGALNFLTQRNIKKNTLLIQEVSLYKGIQLLNEKKIEEAIVLFDKSKKSANNEVKIRSTYWQAESHYRLKNYKTALQKFTTLNNKDNQIKDLLLLDYNIGYTYFKLKDYKNAINSFNNFIKNDIVDASFKNDALVRLGDSFFATALYTNAIESYTTVVNNLGADADYSEYQIGMSYGFLGDNSQKISALTNVVNKYNISSLKDDALFQLASTYTTIKNNTKAHQAYNRLTEKHPTSIFIPKALVKQGLLYYSENKNIEALLKYKETASRFPNSPDALEAVANARNIYIDDGNIEDYVNWIKSLKFININNSDLDNTAYAAAEKKYFESKNGEEIITALTKYTQAYPDGIHRLKANYYLADVLYKIKELDRAIPHYNIVLEEEQNEFSEDALYKLSLIFLDKNQFNNALPLLDRLEQEAYVAENVLFAQSNLMKGYYEIQAFDLAIEYAKKLLLRGKLEKSLEYDAKLIIARAAFKDGDLYTAEDFYKEIEKNATGKLKAEALYYNAFFKNKQDDFTASNKIVQQLIANYSAYKYWAVRSYIIMGKNYYGLDDVYQATFVLENIIKNFTEFEEIVEEAQQELTTIKNNESKKNNSVSPIEEKKDKN